MKLETAIKVIQNDAKFLGITYEEMIKFIAKHPLAQRQKVLEAYLVVKG